MADNKENDKSGGEELDGWWEAGKKGKQSKKVRFVCTGGEEPCDKVIGAKEKSIQCEACLEWYHPKCQKLTTEAFNAINDLDLPWLCKTCRDRLRDLLNTTRRMEECIDRAVKQITQTVMDSKKEAALEVEAKVEDQFTKIEQQMTKQLNSTSESLKKVVQEQEKDSMRGNNLIIHGLKESQKKEPAERREDDLKSVVEIAEILCGTDTSRKVAEVVRLRKKQENNDGMTDVNKPGLVLVKFEGKEDASKLYQERFRLKEAGYRNVYINRDVSKEERERQFKLREELRAKGRQTHRIFRGRVVPRED